MLIHSVQHRAIEIVFLQQIAEAADYGLIRRRRHPEVHAHKTPQCGRVIQRLFHTRIRRVEPLLHEEHPQHDREPHRLYPFPFEWCGSISACSSAHRTTGPSPRKTTPAATSAPTSRKSFVPKTSVAASPFTLPFYFSQAERAFYTCEAIPSGLRTGSTLPKLLCIDNYVFSGVKNPSLPSAPFQ